MLRRNVLIFHQAALGDFIVTWPLAVALGRMFPQSRISYVTHASKGALANRVIGVEAIDAERDWHLLHAPDSAIPAANLKALADAHLIVSFGSDENDVWERNVSQHAPKATVVRLKTSPVEVTPVYDADLPAILANHITAVLVSQLDAMPMLAAGVRQILRSVVTRGLPVSGTSTGKIVMHPGAGRADKCWPVEYFIDLARRLAQRGLAVQVLLGEAELEKWPAETIKTIAAVAEVITPPALVDLLVAIRSGIVFIGNDSGPTHLSGIIGMPTIALFGSSPERWRPIGPRVDVVEGDGIARISVQQVLDAMARVRVRT